MQVAAPAGLAEPATFLDVAALLDGGLPDPPEPAFLHRTDGRALFYAGQVNYLFGDPESGKTLVAQAAAAEALRSGERVAFVDIDHNGPHAIVCRFLDMDVPEETLRDSGRFRYVEPEDRVHLRRVVDDLTQWQPAVAVVDSVGELLPLLGLSSNSPDDFTAAHSRTLKALALSGAAVIAIDHLAKDPDSRKQGSTGTAAKRRAVGGVSIRVTVEDQFTPGHGGSAFLTINKDRHGGLRRHCPVTPGREAVAGVFRIAPGDERIAWSVETPKEGQVPKQDQVDPEDVAALSQLDPAPKSVRDVKDRLRWSTDRATRTLREWRSQRSRSVPQERGTGPVDGVPVFPDSVPRNEERSPTAAACDRCHRPSDKPLILGRCRDCAYPTGRGYEDEESA